MWRNWYQPDKEQHKTDISDCKRSHNYTERKSQHHPRQVLEKSHWGSRDPHSLDRILQWFVQPWNTGWLCSTNWTSFSQPGRPAYIKRRSWGSSDITQERKIGRGGQHTCRTCTSRTRSHDWCSTHHLQQNLADWKMANPVDAVTDHHATKEREPANVPKLSHSQSH